MTLVLLDNENIISGPSDVGGTCPANTYLYEEGGEEFCCCGDECCWDICRWSQPPINCLPRLGTEWIHNELLGYYQVKISKKSTILILGAEMKLVGKFKFFSNIYLLKSNYYLKN